MGELSHVGPGGDARMVDISSKDVSAREAAARAFIRMSAEAIQALNNQTVKKGDVLAVAKIAGVMAAKRTHELIPLCHPLAITGIEVGFEVADDGVAISTSVKTTDRTGVEMEALVAASVAALTIYDMCKSIDKSMTIDSLEVVSKSGGASGDYGRDD